ncbi:SET domain-containing protein [Patescibacteria group bacterium]
MEKSFVSPKVELRESTIGKGVFAKEKISKGEILIDARKDPGTYMPVSEADALWEKGYDYMMQVDDNTFAVTDNPEELEEGDFVNHSCDPNCGIKNRLALAALRDIEPGEEITFDYAMSESTDYRMKCQCGSKNCRGEITGNDWKLPDLQKRYNGFFSDYLQKKIHTA